MRRLVILAALALIASLILMPIARAQGENEEMVTEEVETPAGGEVEIEAEGPPQVVEPAVQQAEQQAVAQPGVEGKVEIEAKGPPPPPPPPPGGGTAPLPTSGGPGISGPAVMLPAAVALLLGSGILAYGILRRRS